MYHQGFLWTHVSEIIFWSSLMFGPGLHIQAASTLSSMTSDQQTEKAGLTTHKHRDVQTHMQRRHPSHVSSDLGGH